MPRDRYRRKRVRNMKKVLRAHGAPVPKQGCLGTLMLAAVLVAANSTLLAFLHATGRLI